jgi:hypothetical protein
MPRATDAACSVSGRFKTAELKETVLANQYWFNPAIALVDYHHAPSNEVPLQ